MTATTNTDTPDDDEMLTAKQTAAILRIPVERLYQWRSLGKHSGHDRGPIAIVGPTGRYLRFRRADVDAWLDKYHESTDGQ